MTMVTAKLYNFPLFRFSDPPPPPPPPVAVVSCEPDVRHLLLVRPGDGVHFLSKGAAAGGERADEDEGERVDIVDEDDEDDNHGEIPNVIKRKTSCRRAF